MLGNKNLMKNIRSSVSSAAVAEKMELDRKLALMAKNTFIYKKLTEPDIYNESSLDMYISRLLEISGYVMDIVSNCVIDKKFMKDVTDFRKKNEERISAREDLEKFKDNLAQHRRFLESSSLEDGEKKRQIEEKCRELEQNVEIAKQKEKLLTEEINGISERTLKKIDELKSISEKDWKYLMFLDTLVKSEDVDFTVEDIKDLSYYLYQTGGAANMRTMLSRLNGIIGQESSYMDIIEQYVEAKGSLFKSGRFDEIYKKICDTEMNVPIDNYDNEIERLETEDVEFSSKRDNSSLGTSYNIETNVVTLIMSMPEYWSLLRTLQMAYDMKASSEGNKDVREEFENIMSIDVDKEAKSESEKEEINQKSDFSELDNIDNESSSENQDNSSETENKEKTDSQNNSDNISEKDDIQPKKKKKFSHDILAKRIKKYLENPSIYDFNKLSLFLEKYPNSIKHESVINIIRSSENSELLNLLEKEGD
jgi:hypothetical protein